jgi:MFS family permease
MYYGWRITAASFFILLVVVGMVYYGFPVFYAPLIEEFGWTRAQVTAGFFYGIVIIGPVFGISAGFLIDRYGARRVLLAGLVSGGVAFSGFATMHSLAAYYLFFFMQTIGYLSSGPMPNQVLISHWFRRMRGRAMGLAHVGIGIGGAIAPVLAQHVIHYYGWRSAMAALAGLIFLLLIPIVILVVRNRPWELGLHPDGDSLPQSFIPAAVTPESAAGLRRAAVTPAFWLILTGVAMSFGAVGGVIQHLQLYLRDQKFTAEDAAQVASLLLLSSIAGRFLMGYLADMYHKKHVMTAAYLMVALPIPILYCIAVPGAVVAFALVFGFGMGAGHMLLPLITAHCFGLASLGRLIGIILTVNAISQAFTPVLIGRLYDLQKSYTWGIAVMTAMAMLGAAAISLIPKRPQTD